MDKQISIKHHLHNGHVFFSSNTLPIKQPLIIKVFVKCYVHFYHEFWKTRCAVLRNPEVQKNLLKEEVLVIMEEASK